MLRLPSQQILPVHKKQLLDWQDEVAKSKDYAASVDSAKRLFSLRNKRGNATFDYLKQCLTTMCCGARRCAYCEDSVADEVEHIRPKDLYPEYVFEWENYVYACGPCNGPKGSNYEIILVDLTSRNVVRHKSDPVVKPVDGTHALIDPRKEDPMHFLQLDISGTFIFLPRLGLSPLDAIRAESTVRVLRLNVRDYLIEARRSALSGYRSLLYEYVDRKRNGDPTAVLERIKVEIQKAHHRTVWKEMQRQQALYPVLSNLFAAAPEALTW